MSCNKMKNLICEYADGVISSEGRKKVDEHVRTCALCARDLEEMQGLKKVLSRVPAVKLPAGFEHEIGEKYAELGRQDSFIIKNTVSSALETAVYYMRRAVFSNSAARYAVPAFLLLLVIALFSLFGGSNKGVPIGSLIMAHNDRLKSTGSAHGEVSKYVASTIVLDGNYFVPAGR